MGPSGTARALAPVRSIDSLAASRVDISPRLSRQPGRHIAWLGTNRQGTSSVLVASDGFVRAIYSAWSKQNDTNRTGVLHVFGIIRAHVGAGYAAKSASDICKSTGLSWDNSDLYLRHCPPASCPGARGSVCPSEGVVSTHAGFSSLVQSHAPGGFGFVLTVLLVESLTTQND